VGENGESIFQGQPDSDSSKIKMDVRAGRPSSGPQRKEDRQEEKARSNFSSPCLFTQDGVSMFS
jgi:hypothetical protein